MKGELFLAWRYLKPQSSTISLLTYTSLLGPILGVGILIVVISVMNGIPRELEKKLIDYNSHIDLSKEGTPLEYSSVTDYIENNYNVKTSPTTLCPVLIQTEDGESEVQIAKGIIPDKDASVSKLKNILEVNSDKDVYELSQSQVILSRSTADKLKLSIGDKVSLHSPEMYKSIQQTDSQRSDIFEIVNIFSTGVADIDNNSMIVHLETANRLMNLQISQAQQIEVALTDPYIAEEVADKMSEDLKLSYFYITPWQRMHTIQFYYRLINNQKALMMFVLFFIVVGAALGVAACLFSMVIQKTQEIGILKATGVSPASIIFIFVCQGGLLGTLGSCLGLAGGFFTIIYRKQVAELFGFWDATLYKLKEVPAYYELSDIAIIFIGSVLICTLASAIPAIIAASVNPVKALQSKG